MKNKKPKFSELNRVYEDARTSNQKNNLDNIFSDQYKFNENFHRHSTLSQGKQVELTKELMLQLYGECDELLRETAYKSHRKMSAQIIASNLKEEWIDIFKYWLSIGLVWGFDSETLFEEYWRKSKVVEQRYHQEKTLDLVNNNKLVALDVDGVLADYPDSFQKFIKNKTGIWINISTYDLYSEYARIVGHEKMLQLKHEYRETGQKRYIPVIPGATQLCDDIHDLGYNIIFLTSRPVKRYARIFADTIEWLEKNRLKQPGDAIIFDEDKNYRAVREFPMIRFMVEDNLKFATEIAQLGIPVFLLDKIYNKTDEQHPNIIRVETLEKIPCRKMLL